MNQPAPPCPACGVQVAPRPDGTLPVHFPPARALHGGPRIPLCDGTGPMVEGNVVRLRLVTA